MTPDGPGAGPGGGLTIAEELVLLVLGDGPGAIPDLPFGALGISLAGAALMQLALDGRIDSDPAVLVLVSPAPTGDRLLDEVLEQVVLATAPHPTAWWLELLAQRREEFLALVIASLTSRGILRMVDERALWKSIMRVYPAGDDHPDRAVKGRLLALLFSDELPDPRDGVLIALAEVTGILPRILSEDELRRARPRIEQVKALEEIGRSVTGVAAQVLSAIAMALPLV